VDEFEVFVVVVVVVVVVEAPVEVCWSPASTSIAMG